MSNRAMNWSAMLWTNKCDGWSRPWCLYIFKKGTNKYFQVTFKNSILSMQTAIHPKKVITMLIWNEFLMRKYFQFCNEVRIACPKTIQMWCCPFLATFKGVMRYKKKINKIQSLLETLQLWHLNVLIAFCSGMKINVHGYLHTCCIRISKDSRAKKDKITWNCVY